MGADYAELVAGGAREAITRHALTGLGRAIIANRISYTLGLSGPSLTVDTGQSSSLVAVHLACESLIRGESELALAGGVNLILDLWGGARVRVRERSRRMAGVTRSMRAPTATYVARAVAWWS